nr:YadA-like family protein [Escherichia coli]
MKSVKLSLLAVVVATIVSPSAFADDTVEAAATELTAIHPGMSHDEIDQKINRFMIRTGNTEAAQDYLFSHGYMDPQTGDNIYPASTAVQTDSNVTDQNQADRDAAQDTAIQNAHNIASIAAANADDAKKALTTAQSAIDANKGAIADTQKDVADVKASAAHANTNANTALMNGLKLSGAVSDNKNQIEKNSSSIAEQQEQMALSEQNQIHRDAAQDSSIQDAQHSANWASLKADDAHHAIMVAQTDIDANKSAISDTQKDVAAVRTDVSAMKDDVADVKASADHANANANTALMNGQKLSGVVSDNKNQIEKNSTAITEQQEQITATQKTVAATGDVKTAARYQSMINALQTATADAQQSQSEAQQTQITEQQKQIAATEKTVAAIGDPQSTAHYQKMINAKLTAQNEANERSTADQEQRINELASNVATQEQIESLTQDSAQTHQQLTNTQKRVADNSQQINSLNNNFSSLKHEVEDNRKEANAGIASAVAIASQPQVKTGDFMMVSAGAGTFNNESAVSVGASFNAGIHTVIKAGVSADTQSDFGAGVGVGYSF